MDPNVAELLANQLLGKRDTAFFQGVVKSGRDDTGAIVSSPELVRHRAEWPNRFLVDDGDRERLTGGGGIGVTIGDRHGDGFGAGRGHVGPARGIKMREADGRHLQGTSLGGDEHVLVDVLAAELHRAVSL